MPSLPITHQPQHRQADCLVACAKMVLDYLGVANDYDQLVQTLRIGPAGAPFRNLHHLQTFGVTVLVERGVLSTLEGHLSQGLPVIAFVDTGWLSYWSEQTQHAIVVAGLEAGFVFVHDPAFADAPKQLSIAEFDLAWLEMDEYDALITRP